MQQHGVMIAVAVCFALVLLAVLVSSSSSPSKTTPSPSPPPPPTPPNPPPPPKVYVAQPAAAIWSDGGILCPNDTINGTLANCIVERAKADVVCDKDSLCIGYLRPSTPVRAQHWAPLRDFTDPVLLVSSTYARADITGTVFYKKPS